MARTYSCTHTWTDSKWARLTGATGSGRGCRLTMVWLWTGRSVMGTTLNMMVPCERACCLVVGEEWRKKRVSKQTGSDESSTSWLRSWPCLLTTIWMTCSGSIPSTGNPLTSTTLSPAWSRPPHTHRHAHTKTQTHTKTRTNTRTHRVIGVLSATCHSCHSLSLTTALCQPSVDDASDEDLTAHLVPLDGGSLEHSRRRRSTRMWRRRKTQMSAG